MAIFETMALISSGFLYLDPPGASSFMVFFDNSSLIFPLFSWKDLKADFRSSMFSSPDLSFLMVSLWVFNEYVSASS